jgi:hypothetical protein
VIDEVQRSSDEAKAHSCNGGYSLENVLFIERLGRKNIAYRSDELRIYTEQQLENHSNGSKIAAIIRFFVRSNLFNHHRSACHTASGSA